MSDLGLIAAPPPDAQALAASALRPPVAEPAANRIAPSRPAGAPAVGDSGTEPFAALLMGFFQGAQPAPPALTADGDTTTTDPLLLPDAATDSAADAAKIPAMPLVVVPGQQTQTATLSAPVSGTALPASGSILPPELPEIPTGFPGAGQPPDAQPATEAELGEAVPAPRISLADIEHSRQLNMATVTTPLQTGIRNWTDRFMPLPDSPMPGLATSTPVTDGMPDSLAGAEPGAVLSQPAGLTAGDLSRLVQNLSQGGGREAFAAVFNTAGSGTGSLFSEASASTANSTQTTDSSGLGTMVRGSLSGFPPLQPLGPAQAWTSGLGDRLLTLAGPGTHSARLKLHPESLGTLDIEVKISDSTAQVWFGAQHSHTREAIEASLPQLREMFAEQGIRLAHAQVDSGTDRRPPDQQQAFNETPVARNEWQRSSARTSLPDGGLPARQAASRLLDAWA